MFTTISRRAYAIVGAGAVFLGAVLPVFAQTNPPSWWGASNDPMTQSFHYGFADGNPTNPQPDNPPDQYAYPPAVGTSGTVTAEASWNGRDDVIKLSGAEGASITFYINNLRVAENYKTVWIQFDYWVQACGCNKGELIVPPDCAVQTVSSSDAADGTGWVTRTVTYRIRPQPEWEDLTIDKQGSSGVVVIDNLSIGVHCEEDWKKQGDSEGCFFDQPAWPPDPEYRSTEPGFGGTLWDWQCIASLEPEWLPLLGMHEGALGIGPASAAEPAVMLAHVDTGGYDAPSCRICCQYDYYDVEGGTIEWQQTLPPGCVVGDWHESQMPMADGWTRVAVSYEVSPPPAWHEFSWVFLPEALGGGALLVDNVVMSTAYDRVRGAERPAASLFEMIMDAPAIEQIVRLTPWADSFEEYPPGSDLLGQGGWTSWDGDPLCGGYVVEMEAPDGVQALEVAGNTDLVQLFDDCDGGQWVFSTWQYIPSDFQSGGDPPLVGSFFVIMNTYEEGTPHEEDDWSCQMQFDSNDGMLKVYYGDGLNTVDRPYIPDEWVEIQVRIDLDDDRYGVFYDGEQVGTTMVWTAGVLGGGGGAGSIAALDLSANGSTPIYYDKARLTPVVAGSLDLP